MRYEVWHHDVRAESRNFNFTPLAVSEWPEHYDHVATVEAGDLEDVFRLTNSMHVGWWLNEGVVAHNGPTRSTSVGDVVESPDGRFVVDRFGFKRF